MSKILSLREVEKLNDHLVSTAMNMPVPRDGDLRAAIYASMLHSICDALECDTLPTDVDEILVLSSAHLMMGREVNLTPLLRVLACPRSLIEELCDE